MQLVWSVPGATQMRQQQRQLVTHGGDTREGVRVQWWEAETEVHTHKCHCTHANTCPCARRCTHTHVYTHTEIGTHTYIRTHVPLP